MRVASWSSIHASHGFTVSNLNPGILSWVNGAPSIIAMFNDHAACPYKWHQFEHCKLCPKTVFDSFSGCEDQDVPGEPAHGHIIGREIRNILNHYEY